METSEQIAFKLMALVALAEGRKIVGLSGGADADRKYILDTYAECLEATKGQRQIE